MMIRVNKNTGTKRQTVKYAALSTGTVSAVWYDDESTMVGQKRQNRIKLTRSKPDATPHYDA